MDMTVGRWTPPSGGEPLAAWYCRHREIEVVVLPDRGAKIVSLQHRPTRLEWLWLNPHLPWRPPHARDSFVALHDVGGWDECFPTVAPTVVNGRRWADHGDLWWRRWQVEARGSALLCSVEGDGYSFARRIESSGDGLWFGYEVTNTGSMPLPYLWCAHPLFKATPPIEIELEGRPEVRFGSHSPFGERGDCFHWPSSESRTFSQVGKPSQQAVKLFAAVESGRVTLQHPDGPQLTLRWSAAKLPILGIWVNEGGWSGAGTPPYTNVGIEPGNGAPDDLAVAMTEWECYRQLEPNERHTWSLTLNMQNEDS